VLDRAAELRFLEVMSVSSESPGRVDRQRPFGGRLMTVRQMRVPFRCAPTGTGGGAVRATGERSVATYSRRHIDLQRVAGALCPGAPQAGAGPRTAPLPRTAG
jgi:hypothetical protein